MDRVKLQQSDFRAPNIANLLLKCSDYIGRESSDAYKNTTIDANVTILKSSPLSLRQVETKTSSEIVQM